MIGFIACQPKSQKSTNNKTPIPITLEKFRDGIHHWKLFADDLNYERYPADDLEAIAQNFVKYQNEDGGWPKNMDWLAKVNIDSLKSSLSDHAKKSTFDNENTHSQIEFLAKMYYNSGNETYHKSALKGLEYILSTQNASGGWRGWDVDGITFNDKVMTGIMDLLYYIHINEPQYLWVTDKMRKQLEDARLKALDATIKCQIVVNGVKTGWCQQHSHTTYEPIQARTYELPSIASKETSEVVRHLMRLANTDTTITHAIKYAVEWLQKSQLHNFRVEKIPVPKGTYEGVNLEIDRVVVEDSTAKPIWARFYEIETNRPFMCTRAGKKVYSLAEVNPERRAGYGWYGYWPEKLLNKEYPAWLKKTNDSQ